MAAANLGMIEPIDTAGLRGFLHTPYSPSGAGLVITHGAGSDCNTPLLLVVADAFSQAGVAVLRCDLAFRQKHPKGPPFPSAGAGDRRGLRRAAAYLKSMVTGPLYLAGHSYGGRQVSLLAAEEPDIATGLLLLSYPLHPPKKPEEMRTEHFGSLRTRCVFVSGDRDPFGAVTELEEAFKAIAAPKRFLVIAGASHDLKKGQFLLNPVVQALLDTDAASTASFREGTKR
jgi:uncharacterized protein